MKTSITWLLVLLLAAGAGCAPNDPLSGALTAEPAEAGNQSLLIEATVPAGTSTPSAPGATVASTPTVAGSGTLAPAATLGPTTLAPAATMSTNIPPELLGLPVVDPAKADLAARLSVTPDAIEVVAVQAMTWSDTSMGCPDPTMSYLQVLTDGHFIQLAYAGQVYNYHSGGGRPPFLCEQPLGGLLPPEVHLGKTPPPPPSLP
jgi:hypothetical protein